METTMPNPIRLYMSMSLDGYIAGLDDRPGQELGRDGGRLFNWLDDRESDGPSGQVYREIGRDRRGDLAPADVRTRRTLAGRPSRRRADLRPHPPCGPTGTCHPARRDSSPMSERCAREARAAAGDRAVMVHGASAAQALLRAGLMDEMEIHLVQVLLGDGRRLFDHLGGHRIELDLVRRLEDRDVTHLRYASIARSARMKDALCVLPCHTTWTARSTSTPPLATKPSGGASLATRVCS